MTIKISRFRMDMGSLPINNVTEIKLLNPPADLTVSGLIVTVTKDTSDSFGIPLYVKVTTGNFATANATDNTTAPCVALAIDSGTGAGKKVLLNGVIQSATAWSWITGPGDASLIYLSASGVLTQTQPSATDNVIQVVGWALSADTMYFSPSMMYFTHT